MKFLFGKKSAMADLAAEIVAHADDGVIVVDSDHRIVLFNASAEKIFGFSVYEVKGQTLNMLLPDRYHMRHTAMVDEYGRTGARVKPMGQRLHQITGRRKDGSEFPASVTIIKSDAGGGRYYAALVRDITEAHRSEEELRRQAATDPLTGVFSRREFAAMGAREAMRANRYDRPLALLLMDIDDFKGVNDTYGHAAGDKLLQRLATLYGSNLRNVDILARWDGGTFAALLPETDVEGAQVIAGRLVRAAAEGVLSYHEQKIAFTVSVGIAAVQNGENNIDGAVVRAENALAEARRKGTGQIAAYQG